MAAAVFVVVALSRWLGLVWQGPQARLSQADRRSRTWRAEEEAGDGDDGTPGPAGGGGRVGVPGVRPAQAGGVLTTAPAGPARGGTRGRRQPAGDRTGDRKRGGTARPGGEPRGAGAEWTWCLSDSWWCSSPSRGASSGWRSACRAAAGRRMKDEAVTAVAAESGDGRPAPPAPARALAAERGQPGRRPHGRLRVRASGGSRWELTR
jgi:hypothetical protein